MLTKILGITGAVCMLVSVVGLINRLFGTHLGVGTSSGSSDTGAIPGDPVIVGFFFIVGAICLAAAYFIDKRQTARGTNAQLNQQN